MSTSIKSNLRKVLSLGGEVAAVAVHLTTSTTAIGKAGAILGIANALIGPTTLASRFDKLAALTLPRCLRREVFRVLMDSGRLRGGAEDGKQRIWTLDGPGVQLAWVKDGVDMTGIAGPWLVGCDEEAGSNLLGQTLWEVLGPRIKVTIKGYGEEAEVESGAANRRLNPPSRAATSRRINDLPGSCVPRR